MARAREGVERVVGIVMWPLVLVAHQHRHGCAECDTLFDAGLDLHAILLVSLMGAEEGSADARGTRVRRLTGVVSADWPGRRRESCTCTSCSDSAMPGGTPSTMQPTEAQCDSPYVVTRKWEPNVDMM